MVVEIMVGGSTEVIFVEDLTPSFFENLRGLDLTWVLVDVVYVFWRVDKSWTLDKDRMRDNVVVFEI